MTPIDSQAVAALRGRPISFAVEHELIEDVDGFPLGVSAVEWNGIFTGIGALDDQR